MNTGEFYLGDAEPYDEPLQEWESEATRQLREGWRPDSERQRAIARRPRGDDPSAATPVQLRKLTEMVRELFWRRALDQQRDEQIRQLQHAMQRMAQLLSAHGIEVGVRPRAPTDGRGAAGSSSPGVEGAELEQLQHFVWQLTVAARECFEPGTVSVEESWQTDSDNGTRYLAVEIVVDGLAANEYWRARARFDEFLDTFGEAPELDRLVLVISPSDDSAAS